MTYFKKTWQWERLVWQVWLRRLSSAPSLCIYTDGKLLNFLWSLGKRDMIGDVYSFGIRQTNILYYYILLHHPHILASPHSPTATPHSTPPPSRLSNSMLWCCLRCPVSHPVLPTPRGSTVAAPKPSPTAPLITLFTPREKTKIYHYKSICNSGLRSTHV